MIHVKFGFVTDQSKMKCARLHLQQRSKAKSKADSPTVIEKPRRYCQKRLINPEHEEDPRWIDIFERWFFFNYGSENSFKSWKALVFQKVWDDDIKKNVINLGNIAISYKKKIFWSTKVHPLELRCAIKSQCRLSGGLKKGSQWDL